MNRVNVPMRKLKNGQAASGSINDITRDGLTVLRPVGPWTPAVHGLLRHLESTGFSGAPRVIGFDESGREILTYLPGDVAMRPWPDLLTAESGIVSLGAFLREYHIAISGYVPQLDDHWRVPGAEWHTGQIIRHGDLGPWNTVWNSAELVGLIDWDFAEPGEAVEDVAQLAWYSVPLRPSGRCEASGIEPGQQQSSRLNALCGTYGVGIGDVLSALNRLQGKELKRTRSLGSAGIEPWSLFLARGDGEEIQEEMDWLLSTYGRFFDS